jgi:hypothetical protein
MAARTQRSGNRFAADVGVWTVQMKNLTKRVWQESVLDLIRIMQTPVGQGGNMPVKTGFLRSSLMVSTSLVPVAEIRRPEKGPFVYFPAEVESTVMGAHVGEHIYIGYTAEYANYAEYGNGSYPGHGFQRLAVQQWPFIVDAAIARVRVS